MSAHIDPIADDARAAVAYAVADIISDDGHNLVGPEKVGAVLAALDAEGHLAHQVDEAYRQLTRLDQPGSPDARRRTLRATKRLLADGSLRRLVARTRAALADAEQLEYLRTDRAGAYGPASTEYLDLVVGEVSRELRMDFEDALEVMFADGTYEQCAVLFGSFPGGDSATHLEHLEWQVARVRECDEKVHSAIRECLQSAAEGMVLRRPRWVGR